MFYLKEVQDAVNWERHRDLSDKSDEQLKVMAYAGLAEEAGEVLGILKREIRNYDKDKAVCTHEHKIEELGDVLWYLALVCITEGIPLEEVWDYNRVKLEARYGRQSKET